MEKGAKNFEIAKADTTQTSQMKWYRPYSASHVSTEFVPFPQPVAQFGPETSHVPPIASSVRLPLLSLLQHRQLAIICQRRLPRGPGSCGSFSPEPASDAHSSLSVCQ